MHLGQVLKLAPMEQLRKLRELLDNPWYQELAVLRAQEQSRDLMTAVMNYAPVHTGQLFTREQLLGEIRGIHWVHEQASGKFLELQSKQETQSPIQ